MYLQCASNAHTWSHSRGHWQRWSYLHRGPATSTPGLHSTWSAIHKSTCVTPICTCSGLPCPASTGRAPANTELIQIASATSASHMHIILLDTASAPSAAAAAAAMTGQERPCRYGPTQPPTGHSAPCAATPSRPTRCWTPQRYSLSRGPHPPSRYATSGLRRDPNPRAPAPPIPPTAAAPPHPTTTPHHHHHHLTTTPPPPPHSIMSSSCRAYVLPTAGAPSSPASAPAGGSSSDMAG